MSAKNRQRTFHVTKKGKRVGAILDGMGGKFVFREMQVNETLDIDRVFAVDTESLKTHDSPLKTLLTTIRFSDSDELIETPDGTGMLEKLCVSVLERFGEDAQSDSDTKQRPKRKTMVDGRESNHGRDGRRTNLVPVLSVWFNLAYDFGRLASDCPQILKSTLVGADSFRIQIPSKNDGRLASLAMAEGDSDSAIGHRPSNVSSRYEIEVVRMHFGSSSSFEWYIRDHIDNKIVRMLGLDLTGYWKTTLRAAAKAAGVTEKKDIPDDWYQRPREEFSDKEWQIFCEYGLGDVQTTLELYHATVLLLQGIDLRVVRKNGVIPPSAPGAAARIVFALAFDMHPELCKENGGQGFWNRPPTWVDQWGADAYYGGRVFCSNPGIHRDMITLDIKSAYPYAMACLPDPVGAVYEFVPPTEFTHSMVDGRWSKENPSTIDYRLSTGDVEVIEKFAGSYGVLYIDGEGLDDIYPALRTHDLENNRLKYVVGKFQNHAATIPEIVLGVISGRLRVDRICKGVIMRGKPDHSFLREGIVKFFKNKNNKDLPKVQRDMNKLLANSTYGKFVEVNERNYSIFDNFAIPQFEKGEKVAATIARVYAELGDIDLSMADSRWPKELYFGDDDEQRLKAANYYRRATEKLPNDNERSFFSVIEYIEALRYADVQRNEVEQVYLSDFLRQFTRYRCGQYFMPHLAAQVTGLTSAVVGLAASCLKAMQGDTDSVHLILPAGKVCKKDQLASEIGLDGWDEFERLLTLGGYGLEIPGVPELGKWFCESDGGSVESVLCRPKVYSHKFSDDSCKQAKHGFSSFPRVKDDDPTEAKKKSALLLHQAIVDLTVSHKVEYQSRPSPRKLRQAVKHGGIVGEFISRPIELIFQQDINTWIDESGLVRWLTLTGERYGVLSDESLVISQNSDTGDLKTNSETESTLESCQPKLRRKPTPRRTRKQREQLPTETRLQSSMASQVKKRREQKKQSELELVQQRQRAMYETFIKGSK